MDSLALLPDITTEGIEEGEMMVPILGGGGGGEGKRKTASRMRGIGALGGQGQGQGMEDMMGRRIGREGDEDEESDLTDEQIRSLESMMLRMQTVKGILSCIPFPTCPISSVDLKYYETTTGLTNYGVVY